MGQYTRNGYKLDQTGQQTQDILNAVSGKVDKVDGKGLSSNDYTDAEKAKLAGIEAGAEANVNADWNAGSGDAMILNKPDLTAMLAAKQDTLVSGTNIKTVNGNSLLGSGGITLDGSNIDYTGEEGDAAVIHGESIDYNIKALDDMAAYLSNNKQGKINDLDTIRAGAAAGATAYQKPGTGIPATDMASGVQTSLGKADSAYQKPSSGIPASDLASGVIPTVPTALADLSDDSTHRLVTDTEKASWNARDFYFVVGSSSHAGNGSSGSYLSTKWEGTVPGVTTPTDGMKIAYRIKTNTGVATAGAVLSIDGGTTYHPVVFNINSVISTRYSVGSTILITYNATQTAVGYLTSNTKSTLTGCWQIMDYDANTDTKVRQYQKGSNAAGTSPEYPILARYGLTNKDGSYDANYANFHTGATLNTTTGGLTAASFKKTGGTSSEFLKADGSVDSNQYAQAAQSVFLGDIVESNVTITTT